MGFRSPRSPKRRVKAVGGEMQGYTLSHINRVNMPQRDLVDARLRCRINCEHTLSLSNSLGEGEWVLVLLWSRVFGVEKFGAVCRS